MTQDYKVILIVSATLAIKRRLFSIADTITSDRRSSLIAEQWCNLWRNWSVTSKMSIVIDIVIFRKCDNDIEFKSFASAHLYPILRSLCQCG